MPFGLNLSEVQTGKTIEADHVFRLYEVLTGARAPESTFEVNIDGSILVNNETRSETFEIPSYTGDPNDHVGSEFRQVIEAIAGTVSSGFSGSAGDGISFSGSNPTTISVDQGFGLEFNGGTLEVDIGDVGTDLADGSSTINWNGSDLEVDEPALNIPDQVTVSAGDDINVSQSGSDYTVGLENSISVTNATVGNQFFTSQILPDTGNVVDVKDGTEIMTRFDSSNTEVIVGEIGSTAYDLKVTGNIIANPSSDIRMKEDITRIDNSTDILSQISGYHFKWKDENQTLSESGYDYGVVAQEVETVMPDAVVERPNGEKGVSYNALIPVLIEEVKSQRKEIQDLKDRLKNK
jgi:hypothetical protein